MKYKAMELWAEGRTDKEVGVLIGRKDHPVGAETIGSWRRKKVPQDWVHFKTRVQDEAKREVERILISRQINIHVQHYRDWETIRKRLMRSMEQPRIDTEEGAAIVWEPREMTSAALRNVATTYKEIQKGQRLALGIPAEHVLTEEVGASETRDDRAKAVLDAVGLQVQDLESIGDHIAKKISEARVVDDDTTDAE
ncbi:hypothetical protein KAW64_17310 [bacterium]|nr:hypothetical protein [bacterium]